MRYRVATRGLLSAVAALMLGLSASAFACTNLAAINLSSTSGKPGDTITVTGSGFGGGMDVGRMDDMGMDMGDMTMGDMAMGSTSSMLVRSPVVLRWNGADGPELTSAIPDKSGAISVTFTIPETQPGHYVLLAVQKNPEGVDVYGTPARASVEVLTASGRSVTQPLASSGAGAGGESSSLGLITMTIALGALSLGLFAAGGIATARQLGRRRVPARVAGRTG